MEDRPSLGGKNTAKVPHGKKPKVRPPRGFRDQVMFPGRALPTYSGPYSVGTMEIEVPAQNPRTFSNITRKKRHLLQLETVLVTIYYPTSAEARQLQTHGHGSKPSRQLWLGRPRLDIVGGYAHFSGVPRSLLVPLFMPALFTKLPAYRNAPIAQHWAPTVDVKTMGTKVKGEPGEKPDGAPDKPCFPLMMFSHGLGGTRTMYSSICGEFASYGFVVCAVEHRDGSGPRTYVNHGPRDQDDVQDDKQEGEIDHDPVDRRRGYDVIDYTFPQDNPYDTGPNNPKGVDTELRGAQIDLRLAELEEAYAVIETITSGRGHILEKHNRRRKGFKASSSHGLENIDWDAWKDRIRLDYVTAAGHSFGGATVVEMLRHDDRFHYFSQGIIYDIWGAGTRPADDDPSHRIKAPIIAINSEAFTYWPRNFQLVKSLINEAQDEPNPCPAWLLTVRGTVHISQSDFSLLYPITCALFLKQLVNPRRALDLNINASLEFLSMVMPTAMGQVLRAYRNESLLESSVNKLDHIPSSEMHKPRHDAFIAVRLGIRHEWLYRTSPKLFRKFKRKKAEYEGRTPENFDEIWLHVKPSEEKIEEYLRRHPKTQKAMKEEIGTAPTSNGDTSKIRVSEEVQTETSR